jgi:hypothetical protein
MINLKLLRWLLFLIGSLALIALAGCNLPSDTNETPTLNVTQAYQTVEARLTQAIALTPSPSTSPSPTQGNPVQQTSPSVTAQPSTTPTLAGTKNTTSPASCDLAAPGLPIDVTVPDGTEMQPGQQFTKTWRLQNVGTCTWSDQYDLVYFSGEQLEAPSSVPLSEDVPPGKSVDLSVDMTAPEKPGTYRGNWKLRDEDGTLFGIGPSGGSAFWVEIKVVNPPAGTSTATLAITLTPTTTPTVAIQASGSAVLTPGDRLDLDTNQVNPGSGEDLALEAGDGNHQLVPLGGTAIAVMGGAQPTLNDCQTTTLSADSLVVEGNLAAGIYLCYRSDMALPGRAFVSGFDAETATLTLEILTWAIP